MKKCYKCKEYFALTEFYKNKSRPDGLQKWCKQCCKANDKERIRPYCAETQARYKKSRSAYYHATKDLTKRRAANKAIYQKNKLPYILRALARTDRIRQASICPNDLPNIEAIYAKATLMRLAGDDVEVDHIVPLNGEFVCGLHVSWNLQIIPAAVNRSKSNRFEEQV